MTINSPTLTPWTWAALFENAKGHRFPVGGNMLIADDIDMPEAQAETYIRLYLAETPKYKPLTLIQLAVRRTQ
jgi:hypothetical protein